MITTAEFVNTVMSVVEGISQHPALLMEHSQVVIETVAMILWSFYYRGDNYSRVCQHSDVRCQGDIPASSIANGA